MSHITQYYVTQAGGGGHFYAGSSYQKGYGIGSWLGGLFRSVLPVLRRGAIAAGKEAARAGSHVLADVASGENVKESLSKHAKDTAHILANKLKRKMADSMQGSGAIKRRKASPSSHSAVKARRSKTSKRAPDCFS